MRRSGLRLNYVERHHPETVWWLPDLRAPSRNPTSTTYRHQDTPRVTSSINGTLGSEHLPPNFRQHCGLHTIEWCRTIPSCLAALTVLTLYPKRVAANPNSHHISRTDTVLAIYDQQIPWRRPSLLSPMRPLQRSHQHRHLPSPRKNIPSN
jgi:hypothetical protein